MLTIGTDEIASIRAEIESALLPDTCTILSVTNTSAGAGGMRQTWGTAYASVSCRIDHLTGREQDGADATQPQYSFIGTFKQDQTISVTNRVVYSGGTFEVMSISTPTAWQCVKRVGLERVAHV